ncbi:MAG: replication-associated recombination protein A [Bacilli bacterium]|nr:replication-associated recombination protein A [Bacilli bacterium]MBO6285799.1 replication-associated recombination protein A [Bacilli bacterium]
MSDQLNLFEENSMGNQPLASRLRPKDLEHFVGQKHLLGNGRVLRRFIEEDKVTSMIFWGPPGVGKTTLASIIAEKTKSRFINFSAVTSGIKEIKQVMEASEEARTYGKKTILFVDEIHRFNKAQQDAFLPFVEKGSIILIGATTENPSFEVNAALLSRCKVFVLQALKVEDILELLHHALSVPEGFGNEKVEVGEDSLNMIASFSNGDARKALSTLEIAVLNGKQKEDGTIVITLADIEEITSKKSLLYDKGGDQKYDIISALHKSMRNSDPDAALYWLARMLEAGEDPLYIARRLIRFSSEDIGLADTHALPLATSAFEACKNIGMPECNVILAEAVTYLSLAPKSNAIYVAYENVAKDALKEIAEPVPLHIRNAPTNLMKDLGYGEGYQYAHDFEEKLTPMVCLPPSLENKRYYFPSNQGMETKYGPRLEAILEWKKKHRKK